MKEDEVIIVDVPSYIKKFSAHLAQVPARVQANYMLWRKETLSEKEDSSNFSLR